LPGKEKFLSAYITPRNECRGKLLSKNRIGEKDYAGGAREWIGEKKGALTLNNCKAGKRNRKTSAKVATEAVISGRDGKLLTRK